MVEFYVHRAIDYRHFTGPPSITGLEDDIALLEMGEHFNLEILTPACLSRNQSGALEVNSQGGIQNK